MPVGTFRSLLDALVGRGCRFLTADDAVGLRVLRSRSVLLTFDDGRQDNLDVVLPILTEYGILATFYVCPGLVGKRSAFVGQVGRDRIEDFSFDMMSWDELRQLRDSGMCLGSHTANHVDLTQCNTEQLELEIVGSKAMLETGLGCPIRHFSYPWGRFTEQVLQRVRAAGYITAAAVSVNADAPIHPWDAFTLPRVTAHPASTPKELLRSIAFPNLLRRTLSQSRRSVAAFAGRAA
jgi:peptidoglycan/xylan/chitin deacetylase (PgdA/CDA1 family)